MHFLGVDMVMKCPAWQSEYQMRVPVVVKNQAWGVKDALSPLVYEEWVRDRSHVKHTVKIEPVVVRQSEAARRLCAGLIRDPRVATFADMKRIIAKKAEVLRGADQAFILELTWLDTAPQALEQAVLAKALSF